MSLKKIRLPLIIFSGSLVFLVALLLATSPVNNIGFAVVFFLLFFVFINSMLYLLVALKGDAASSSRERIVLISTFIAILLMFSSARSLNIVDLLILVLIVFGLYFYMDRRR